MTRRPAGRWGPFGLHPTILLLAGTHFIVDGYGNILAPLLPLLITNLNLSLAAAGTLQMCFQLANSVSQLAFGYLADRWRPRVLLIAGPILGVSAITLIGLAPNPILLAVVLILGGLGGAAFHPPAAALVHQHSGPQRGIGDVVPHHERHAWTSRRPTGLRPVRAALRPQPDAAAHGARAPRLRRPGFFGGPAADRFGARRVIILSLVSAVPFLVVAPLLSGWSFVVVLAIGGFLLQSTLPVNVTFGQTIAPISAATVSSLMMGFAWGVGGLIVPFVGMLADRIGIEHTLMVMSAVPLLAAALAWPLPAGIRATGAQPSPGISTIERASDIAD